MIKGCDEITSRRRGEAKKKARRMFASLPGVSQTMSTCNLKSRDGEGDFRLESNKRGRN